MDSKKDKTFLTNNQDVNKTNMVNIAIVHQVNTYMSLSSMMKSQP